jgi:hypothetical protein
MAKRHRTGTVDTRVADGTAHQSIARHLRQRWRAQTLRQAEGSLLTASNFAEVRSAPRSQYQELLRRMPQGVQGQLDEAARSIGKDAGVTDLAAGMGQLYPQLAEGHRPPGPRKAGS